MDPLALLQEFVAVPAPPGDERRLREVLKGRLAQNANTDAKGNLVVGGGGQTLVTAHLDEIAMVVTRVWDDGALSVRNLGGLKPWKLGEGPVLAMADEDIDGVLAFGSIHTEDPTSTVRQADTKPIEWSMARVVTGRTAKDLDNAGVRPGTRVVVHPSRRNLTPLGDLVSDYFLDDRALLVSWLIALGQPGNPPETTAFAATVSEEVGGHGALYLCNQTHPELVIALELGPEVEDAPVELNDQPTVWVTDSYAAPDRSDLDWVDGVAKSLGLKLQFQALSRGGSDASIAASHGLCARHLTLGVPIGNSHGYEVMHPDAVTNLARLVTALVAG